MDAAFARHGASTDALVQFRLEIKQNHKPFARRSLSHRAEPQEHDCLPEPGGIRLASETTARLRKAITCPVPLLIPPLRGSSPPPPGQPGGWQGQREANVLQANTDGAHATVQRRSRRNRPENAKRAAISSRVVMNTQIMRPRNKPSSAAQLRRNRLARTQDAVSHRHLDRMDKHLHNRLNWGAAKRRA